MITTREKLEKLAPGSEWYQAGETDTIYTIVGHCRIYSPTNFNQAVLYTVNAMLYTANTDPGEQFVRTLDNFLEVFKPWKRLKPAQTSKYVSTITIDDPDTHENVELEVRKLASGLLVGYDESFLVSLDDEDQVPHPYIQDTIVVIPADEDRVVSDKNPLGAGSKLTSPHDHREYVVLALGRLHLDGRWHDAVTYTYVKCPHSSSAGLTFIRTLTDFKKNFRLD